MLDWYTKKIVGYYAGMPCAARQWLEALDMAVNRQFPDGAQGQGVSLMSDNGCQPTSLAFMQACATLEIHQAFTSYNNPKGNADTERCMRTLKEECLWLHEWRCPFALASALAAWIDDYNEHYLHSALGYKTPGSLNETTTPVTALRSSPLDKWGALHPDAGVDVSALSAVRSRLLAGVAEERLLTQLLAHVVERGLLKARGKQRPDAPPIVAAVGALHNSYE